MCLKWPQPSATLNSPPTMPPCVKVEKLRMMRIKKSWSSGLRTMSMIIYTPISTSLRNSSKRYCTCQTRISVLLQSQCKKLIRIIPGSMISRVFICGVTLVVVNRSFWKHFSNHLASIPKIRYFCITRNLCSKFIKGSIKLIRSWKDRKATRYHL